MGGVLVSSVLRSLFTSFLFGWKILNAHGDNVQKENLILSKKKGVL